MTGCSTRRAASAGSAISAGSTRRCSATTASIRARAPMPPRSQHDRSAECRSSAGCEHRTEPAWCAASWRRRPPPTSAATPGRSTRASSAKLSVPIWPSVASRREAVAGTRACFRGPARSARPPWPRSARPDRRRSPPGCSALDDARLRQSERRDLLRGIVLANGSRDLGYAWLRQNLDALAKSSGGIFFAADASDAAQLLLARQGGGIHPRLAPSAAGKFRRARARPDDRAGPQLRQAAAGEGSTDRGRLRFSQMTDAFSQSADAG